MDTYVDFTQCPLVSFSLHWISILCSVGRKQACSSYYNSITAFPRWLRATLSICRLQELRKDLTRSFDCLDPWKRLWELENWTQKLKSIDSKKNVFAGSGAYQKLPWSSPCGGEGVEEKCMLYFTLLLTWLTVTAMRMMFNYNPIASGLLVVVLLWNSDLLLLQYIRRSFLVFVVFSFESSISNWCIIYYLEYSYTEPFVNGCTDWGKIFIVR